MEMYLHFYIYVCIDTLVCIFMFIYAVYVAFDIIILYEHKFE